MRPSAEAEALAARFAAGPAARCIAEIRAGLEAEYGPRAARASKRYAVSQSEQQIGGVACLVLTPEALQSDVVILYLFGGGYVSGAPEFELPIAAHLSAATGLRLVLPRYPLAPERPAPAAFDAAMAVYQALEGAVVLSGESAGGGLALCLSARRAPRAMCLFSPWVDLTEAAHDAAPLNDPTLQPEHLRLCAQAYTSDPVAVSPAQLALPKVPTYITSGTRDIMQPMLQGFAAKHPVQLDVWPGLWHVFEAYDELPEAAQSLDQAAAFITEHAS